MVSSFLNVVGFLVTPNWVATATNGKSLSSVALSWSLVPTFIILAILVIGGLREIRKWRAMAQSYPDRKMIPLRTFRGISGSFSVDLGEEGLRISPPFLFQAVFPPVLFPWAAIMECQTERMYSVESLRITVNQVPGTIQLAKGWRWANEDFHKAALSFWNQKRSEIAPLVAA